jgi:RNA polymerase sigma factor (sigma-70 family)
LPVVRPGEASTPALDQALARAAVAAATGDAEARDALYFALAWPVSRCIARHRRRAYAANGAWDLDDVGQEAYLAFVETIDEWSGEPPFLSYFAIRFPRRLADAVQRLDRRLGPIKFTDVAELIHDDSAASAESLVLLEAIAVTYPEVDRAILLLRVRDGYGFGAIARFLGLNRRTVYRRWIAIRSSLRAPLAPRADPS